MTTVFALGCAGLLLLLLGVALPLGITLLRRIMVLPLGILLMLLAALRVVLMLLATLGVMLMLLGALLRLLTPLVRYAGRISTVLARFGLVFLLRLMLLRLPMLVRCSAGGSLAPALGPAILFGLVRLHVVMMSFAFARRLMALAMPGAGSLIPAPRVSFSDGAGFSARPRWHCAFVVSRGRSGRHSLMVAATGRAAHALRSGEADAAQKHSRGQQKPVLHDPSLHLDLLQCLTLVVIAGSMRSRVIDPRACVATRRIG
ncbi:MAG: hypothetical protein ACREDL_07620 [Bradyrhizobium sp.]